MGQVYLTVAILCVFIFAGCFVVTWANNDTEKIEKAASMSILKDFIFICFNVEGIITGTGIYKCLSPTIIIARRNDGIKFK